MIQNFLKHLQLNFIIITCDILENKLLELHEPKSNDNKSCNFAEPSGSGFFKKCGDKPSEDEDDRMQLLDDDEFLDDYDCVDDTNVVKNQLLGNEFKSNIMFSISKNDNF